MGTKSVADTSPLSEGLAVAVKVHMARRDMTRKRLVELAGRSEPYWSKRLSGTSGFNLADVEQLATAFAVTPDELIREALREAEQLARDGLLAEQQQPTADAPDDLPDWLALAANTDPSPTDRERFDAEMGDWDPA